MANEIEIWGLNEVDELIKKLPQALQYKVVQDVYYDIMMKGFVKDAKNLVRVAPKDTISKQHETRTHTRGNLKRSIGVVRGTNRSRPVVIAGVKSREVFKKGGKVNDGWYAHMVEYGHKDRSGKFITPRPFLRPAWDMNKHKVVNQIGVAFGRLFTRYARQYNKKM